MVMLFWRRLVKVIVFSIDVRILRFINYVYTNV